MGGATPSYMSEQAFHDMVQTMLKQTAIMYFGIAAVGFVFLIAFVWGLV